MHHKKGNIYENIFAIFNCHHDNFSHWFVVWVCRLNMWGCFFFCFFSKDTHKTFSTYKGQNVTTPFKISSTRSSTLWETQSKRKRERETDRGRKRTEFPCLLVGNAFFSQACHLTHGLKGLLTSCWAHWKAMSIYQISHVDILYILPFNLF